MTEIPVQKKGVPVWIWALVALGVLAVGGMLIGLFARQREPAPAAEAIVEAAKVCATDAECGERQLCLASACTVIKTGGPECATTRVYFETDSAQIRSADQASLDRTARCLRASQRSQLTIEGSADERGTAEHNAELAEKRAMSVAGYLQKHGVSGDQLKVVSYGDNRPLCIESDQECWAKNRQAALKPQ